MSIPGRAIVRALLALVLSLAFVRNARAAIYVPPPIQGYVTDAAGVLSLEEVAALDRKLAAYRACSAYHVVVFVPRTLGGFSVEDVSYGAANTWKIGDAQKDNGVLLVLAPNERKLRIETGKGVGGSFTDLQSSYILREVVTPRMRESHLFAAADEGTNAIAHALGGCAMEPAKVLGTTRTMPAPLPVSQPPPAAEANAAGSPRHPAAEARHR